MKTFKDNKGRQYEVNINIAQIKRVKGVLEADLLDLDATFLRLIADPIFLVDVLYVLCKSQADSFGVSDEDFGEAMAGDTIGLAKIALVEELRNFFPSREEREAAGMAIQKGIELRNAMRKMGLKMLETANTDEIVQTLVNQALGEQSTNLPESAESVPENSPSES
ncbi:MAG: hypothetical protein ACRC2T_01870 [Thermoguttaceae bacterium]